MLSHSECVDSSATVKFLDEKLYIWSPYNESAPSCSSPSRFIRLFYKCVPTGRRIFIVWEAHCETQENAAACSVTATATASTVVKGDTFELLDATNKQTYSSGCNNGR